MKSKLLMFALLAGTAPVPAFAQDQAVPADSLPAEEPDSDEEIADDQEALDAAPAGDEDAIVITGQRLRGQVEGDTPPEVTLSEEDIRAFGASTISDLLEALAPQTRSGRGSGPPVVLLNGRRISSFFELRDMPPEAIERVEILPEEVALRYGYRADQRVVNIVLKENYRAVTTELEYGLATAGGRPSYEIDMNVLRISPAGRTSLNVEYERDGALFESERDLVQSAPPAPFSLTGNVAASPFAPDAEVDPALSAAAGETVIVAAVPASAATSAPTLGDFVPGANAPSTTDLGRFRTLLPETEQLNVNGTMNRTIFNDVSFTATARLGLNNSESRLGLPSVTLTVPEASPFSPFGSDVTLLRYADFGGPLTRESRGRTLHFGFSMNGDIQPWRWSFTGAYDNALNRTRTDTGLDPASLQARLDGLDPALNPYGGLTADLLPARDQDRSRSTSESANVDALFNGPIVDLPAGRLRASLRAGLSTRSLSSETVRAGVVTARDLSRDRAAIQGNFDIPVSERDGALSAIGNVSLNANFEFEHLSDFGTLRKLGYGLRWSPIERVDLNVSMTDEDGAPSMEQLGDPVLLTPNVRVFDFVRGETVDISRLEGGNPNLVAENRRVFAIRASARPLSGDTDFSIVANYTNSRTRNPIAAFPTATPEIEAAFPDRFVRDADGQLLSIDSRPVNFARSNREELRWGFNYSRPFGPQPQGGGGPFGRFGGGGGGGGGARGGGAGRGGEGRRARQPQGQQAEGPEGRQPRGERPQGEQPQGEQRPQRPAGEAGQRRRGGPGGGRRMGGGGRGRGGMFGGGPQGGRLFFSAFHTWRFQDEILIRPGVPELDLLDGSAAGGRGGRSAHEIEVQAAIFKSGLGARLTGNWQSGTFVRGTPQAGGGSGSDLSFSDFTTVNLRLFADLGAQQSLVARHPWLTGTRVSVAVDNLFDSRLEVRDAFGTTPIGYQGDYLDPLGRTVRFSVRKLF